VNETHLLVVILLGSGFFAASILGYCAKKLHVSPIVAYLLAGYLIGPYSPGLVVDPQSSMQIAEIGVVLMMFSVGMHFKLQDLFAVKSIAIPGAIFQILAAALSACWIIATLGWSYSEGIIVGLAIGVASTVVLVRELIDNGLLQTKEGHIAVGWLIVEDIFTIIALVVLTGLATSQNTYSAEFFITSFCVALAKFMLLCLVMFTLVKKGTLFFLEKVAKTRSHELFTISLLGLTLALSVGSAYLFDTSVALGAFLTGMILGATHVKLQVEGYTHTIKDAFVVFFFIAVGMIFNPAVIWNHFVLFAALCGIILLVKPLVAALLVLLFRYPLKTALTVAIALAQIGEFSFILAEEALHLRLLSHEMYGAIIAASIVTIAINPLLFKLLFAFEKVQFRAEDASVEKIDAFADTASKKNRALVVGYGPTGRKAVETLQAYGFETTVLDENIDVIHEKNEMGANSIYADATKETVLESVFVDQTDLLLITVPELSVSLRIIAIARKLNPAISIIARVFFLSEKEFLQNMNVVPVCAEEETLVAFNKQVIEYIEKSTPSLGSVSEAV